MTQQTHCPTCGAKIARADLSICSYCLTPLALGGEKKPRDSATGQRLAKMRDHAEFQAAVAWDPPEGPAFRRAGQRQAIAIGLLVISAASAAHALYYARNSGESWLSEALSSAAGILSIALAACGAILWLWAARSRAALGAHPLLKRPALVTSRRSETIAQGRGHTIYTFTLEFEDGSEGDFRFYGLGASHDPLVAGNLGIAYTRRDNLLAFRLIRV